MKGVRYIRKRGRIYVQDVETDEIYGSFPDTPPSKDAEFVVILGDGTSKTLDITDFA